MKRLMLFYSRHKKITLMVCAVIIVALIVRFPSVAHAQADTETSRVLENINEIFNIILRFFSAWLWPVLLMIGTLLDNDLIFGGAMGDRLLAVWVQIRNLVNIVFVLVLLAIAVYNVLGLGQEGGTLPLAFKTAMPKFVLALIAVNFSFLGVKVVLDFTNVITGAVFALPSTAVEQKTNLNTQLQTIICGSSSEEVPFRPMWCDGQSFNERARSFFGRLDRSNIAVVYAVKFGRAIQLKFIRDGLKDITQLGFNIIFNSVMYVVYALSFIALFLVLLFRVVALWIGVVLSPFIALSIVLPNLKQLAGEGGEIQTQFIQNAIAPIIIGLVLSVGYIMLDGFAADKTIQGHILSSSSLTSIDPHTLPTDILDLQQLMIAVGVVIIVWVGVFTAADKTAAKTITGMIREKAVGFGKFMAKLPTYAQVLPVSGAFGREKASIAEAFATLNDIPMKMQMARGRSLLDGAPPQSEELRKLREAMSEGITAVARELSEMPHLLKTPEGFGMFKEYMMKNQGMKEPEFNKKFGEDHNHYNQAAQGLFTDGRMGSIIQNKFKSVEAFKAAIAGEDKAPVNPDASDIILKLDREPANLKGEKVYTKIKEEFEIKTFQEKVRKLNAKIQPSVVGHFLKEDGMISTDILDDKKMDPTQLNNLLASLENAQDETAIKKALSDAKTASIHVKLIEKVIAVAEFKNPALKRNAEDDLKARGGEPPQQPR